MTAARKSQRRAAGTCALIAAVLVALPAVAGAQRSTLEKVIRRTVLPNGLEVIVAENHGVPLATLEIDVRNGAFTQPPGFEGLAHMYEHMFFKANGDYPEPEGFVQRAAELGAIFNGTTTEERVNYYLTLPSDSLAGGMRFISAALRKPLFRPDELEREREVVLGEYDRQESNPFLALVNETGRILWGSAWSRKNALGERSAIKATTPGQLRAIQRRYYVPNNSVLIVTGDVNPDSVFRLARTVFGDWQRGADPFASEPIPPVPALGASRGKVVEAPVGSVIVLMQWHGPSVGKDPDATYAADVFSDVLNQPNSGFQRRLVDSGLFQGIGVNYYTLNQVGPISINGQTTPDKLRDALAALDREIARFGEPGYLTATELEPVKRQRVVSTLFGVERASGFAHTIGFWWSVASLEYYMGYVDNMARQTAGDLRAYATRYIVGKPRVVGVMIDPASRAQLRLTEAELVPQGGTK